MSHVTLAAHGEFLVYRRFLLSLPVITYYLTSIHISSSSPLALLGVLLRAQHGIIEVWSVQELPVTSPSPSPGLNNKFPEVLQKLAATWTNLHYQQHYCIMIWFTVNGSRESKISPEDVRSVAACDHSSRSLQTRLVTCSASQKVLGGVAGVRFGLANVKRLNGVSLSLNPSHCM